MNESKITLPIWGLDLLACPECYRGVFLEDYTVTCPACGNVGRFDQGILRFGVKEDDPSIVWYRDKGGTYFHERRQIAYTMSNLDTSVYHHYFSLSRPRDLGTVIVDVGAGDGRNSLPWLNWGFERVIVADAVGASLARFRQRVERENPAWLDHILLIECDARRLPLRTESVGLVLAIEALYYLNQDYELGLAQCARVLQKGARLILSERSIEGAAVTNLLYGGISAMLRGYQEKAVWDGTAETLVRSRCFDESELIKTLDKHGLKVRETQGISMLSLLIGYLRGQNKLEGADPAALTQLELLLLHFGQGDYGTRRTHVLFADKCG